MSLRARNRINAMRTTQRVALRLFLDRGFDNVTVEQVATEAGMAPSTVYRHFATKEAIVLWDEHDSALDEALEQELALRRPLDAIRHVLIEGLGDRYLTDLDFQLARIKYIFATEQLHAAAFELDYRYREELAAGLRQVLSAENRFAAPIIAGAALQALDVALDEWQRGDAERPLPALIDEAFEALTRLDSIT